MSGLDDFCNKIGTGLPYVIELWHREGRHGDQLVLARAQNAELARVIFKAAMNEYPERRVTLRKGTQIIAESAG